MKAFRILGLTVLGIVLLLAAVIAIATLVIDPNTYKPQIERAVESSTRLEIDLAGDIDWSIIPLGLSLSQVSADLDGQPFARLDNLVAQVDFWSLLRFEPAVNEFVLEGMAANLTRNEAGQGNWERIMPEQDASQAEAEQAPEEAPAEPAADGEAEPLKFEVQRVRISDAQLRYRDEATGRDLTLDQVNLAAQNITLGTSFPLDLSFHFATNQPALDVNGSISAAIEASEDLKRFAVNDLNSNFDIAGEPLGDETVSASFSGDLGANLEEETATLEGFRAQLINLVLNAELNIKGFGASPQLRGNLAIEPFSARELLDNLGQPPIDTQDPGVLDNIALETNIGGPAGQIELTDFLLTLDDTRFEGNLEYALANGAIGVDLQGDRLDLDRYLPPASETDDAPAEETAGTESAPESDLLPLDALRGLIFDIRLGLTELIATKLKINEIEVAATGKSGLIKVDPIKGELYDGDFLVTAELDARQDNPRWQISQRLNNVQTLPLLTDLAELETISGKVNLQADVTTQGNRITSLREQAQGNASFNIAEGAFETVNLKAYACQGIALAHGETINTSQWPERTAFEAMNGEVQINGNVLNNNNLTAKLGGLDLSGEGTVNLAEMLLDYELGLRIVGAIHEDNACRVNERIQNLSIPLECRGSLEDPAELCSFDGSRFRDQLKDMAAAEAKRKAGKEVDRAVDKQLDKLLGEDEEGEETDGTRKQIKDAVRGLFN